MTVAQSRQVGCLVIDTFIPTTFNVSTISIVQKSRGKVIERTKCVKQEPRPTGVYCGTFTMGRLLLSDVMDNYLVMKERERLISFLLSLCLM